MQTCCSKDARWGNDSEWGERSSFLTSMKIMRIYMENFLSLKFWQNFKARLLYRIKYHKI